MTALTRESVTATDPLRLEDAARLAYPNGGMTVSGLRRERDAGRLVTEITAGKEYTTLADIERMRELCRGLRRVPVSTRNPSGETPPAAPSSSRLYGLSETAELSVARASALRIADGLLSKPKKLSPPTSSKGGRSRANHNVTPLRSPSPTSSRSI